eukprot:CAMPEP_0194388846 /NCGR_PEP_ID=MMETSP0174-20130528/100682_1 /TAXON_ID=216777 /ORGANISM="Proboscia alata, Strain PI-D3" /LENGTH=413 /DNA_ID=CAMNT_0039180509 /DNA_START=416 /DNA_END=1654 /DNA_ORIENTATION=+
MVTDSSGNGNIKSCYRYRRSRQKNRGQKEKQKSESSLSFQLRNLSYLSDHSKDDDDLDSTITSSEGSRIFCDDVPQKNHNERRNNLTSYNSDKQLVEIVPQFMDGSLRIGNNDDDKNENDDGNDCHSIEMEYHPNDVNTRTINDTPQPLTPNNSVDKSSNETVEHTDITSTRNNKGEGRFYNDHYRSKDNSFRIGNHRNGIDDDDTSYESVTPAEPFHQSSSLGSINSSCDNDRSSIQIVELLSAVTDALCRTWTIFEHVRRDQCNFPDHQQCEFFPEGEDKDKQYYDASESTEEMEKAIRTVLHNFIVGSLNNFLGENAVDIATFDNKKNSSSEFLNSTMNTTNNNCSVGSKGASHQTIFKEVMTNNHIALNDDTNSRRKSQKCCLESLVTMMATYTETSSSLRYLEGLIDM